MTLDEIRKKLGRIIHDVADVEQAAVSTCQVMLSTEILAPAERRFLERTILPEERDHDANMGAWATRLYGPKPKRRLAYSAHAFKELLFSTIPDKRRRFAYTFASIKWNEEFNLRWSPRVVRIFERIEPAFAERYAGNMRDEIAHVAWGRQVAARLEAEDPLTHRHYRVYTDYLAAIYPTLISRSHMDVYKKLEAALPEGAVPDPYPEDGWGGAPHALSEDSGNSRGSTDSVRDMSG